MENRYTAFMIVTVVIVFTLSLFTSSCTKEGPPGPPGLDGADATESCMTCHNFSEFIVSKISQHANSIHASGNNINRSGEGCSHCHTSQGFRTYLEDGSFADIHNPNAINCRTCHQIHESYTAADYALRTNLGVDLVLDGTNYDYGNSNLCANCHQARTVNPYPEFGGEDVTITNARYGPHYGPQANMFTGSGAYEIPGSLEYQNSAHTSVITDGCITCHMSDPTGNTTGGHQMGLRYESFGSLAFNYNGCTVCHEDVNALTANRSEIGEEIIDLQNELRDKLIAKGLLNVSEMVPSPLTMTQSEAGAIMNYKYVYGDGSYGMHNYLYTKALLLNTIESLN